VRLIALLSWYDESPTWLGTTVAGIGQFCDGIVAVDGAYALFPGARPRSHPQQAEAIVQAAESCDLDCIVYRPREVWYGNEVAKRNKTLDLAAALEPDWVVIIDADYHLLKCNPPVIRHELEHTELHAANYGLLWTKDFGASPALEQFAAANHAEHEWVNQTRDFYRWTPTLRVGPAHFAYTAEIDGRRQPLKGFGNDLDGLDLSGSLLFYHRTEDRAKARLVAAKRYYDLRNEHRIEVA
jgi:hypothetical protein